MELCSNRVVSSTNLCTSQFALRSSIMTMNDRGPSQTDARVLPTLSVCDHAYQTPGEHCAKTHRVKTYTCCMPSRPKTELRISQPVEGPPYRAGGRGRGLTHAQGPHDTYEKISRFLMFSKYIPPPKKKYVHGAFSAIGK